MVFQGPQATISWIGNEEGVARSPTWNAMPVEKARSGVSTGYDSDPDGEVWLPSECDARIRADWFWSTKNAATLKSVGQLMNMYYRSVGHGAVLLLNHTPDTTGRIPEADARRAAEFGAEIQRRFGRSLAETTGRGATVELDLGQPTRLDHIITAEDIREKNFDFARPGSLRVSTFHSSKGLDFPVILMLLYRPPYTGSGFDDAVHDRMTCNLIYVAAIRAMDQLCVFTLEDPSSAAIGDLVGCFGDGAGDDDGAGESAGTKAGSVQA
jgi:hypothetical protein